MTSRYLDAGSPTCCFLPSCRKPFMGTCVHGEDGHFYCSHECAEDGAKIDLTQLLRPALSPEADPTHPSRAYDARLRQYLVSGSMQTLAFHAVSGPEMIRRFGYRECPAR